MDNLPHDVQLKIAQEQEKIWKEMEEKQKERIARGEGFDLKNAKFDSPLFWDKIDAEKIANSEAAQALQALIYNEDEPEETAESLKVYIIYMFYIYTISIVLTIWCPGMVPNFGKMPWQTIRMHWHCVPKSKTPI